MGTVEPAALAGPEMQLEVQGTGVLPIEHRA